MVGGISAGSIEVKDFGERTYIPEIERRACGLAIYDHPLTEDEI